MQRIISDVYDRFKDITDEGRSFEEIRFISLMTAHACHYRMKDCNDQAVKLFKTWMATRNPDTNNT